ncbi:WbqC family protein [Maribellus maritimus]|uniref:WbqC family protein n=1 Tax=Maribellus maritimus TaxID=2870838 RepID=UPI001EEA93F3|nr:WbqC family protein [Maribellus maritimus]MCG6187678.1 WbqC family protein [Maribellus maritimus]
MQDNNAILLSTAYFAPVQYYSMCLKYPLVYIERFENFTKQTYRNRCVILGANGPIPLVIPVVKGRGPKTLIKDLKISYDVDWQRNHWRTIFSAYNSSPFFEFFKDDIFPFFEKKEKYLLELNMKVHETLRELLDIENETVLTSDFESVPETALNYREIISPKNKRLDVRFQPQKYTQVFSEKFDFSPNLSIIDLLFNEGPNSFTVLEESWV